MSTWAGSVANALKGGMECFQERKKIRLSVAAPSGFRIVLDLLLLSLVYDTAMFLAVLSFLYFFRAILGL